ncbi:DUF4232 domain-containing protein [Streptomyces sp. NPDC090994]|uniref:DUF4232 domain-containing protein n=1 Tax=Streptomyces sp. NPDC090994 TaxID=3365969 RepID=UPI00381A4A0C
MSARTTRVRLFAAATVALAALSLTACEDGSATGLRTTSASSDTTAQTGTDAAASGDTAAKDTAGTNGANGTGTGTDTAGKQNSTTTENNADASVAGDCSADDVEITATEVSSPINHLLLTATNTGSKTCSLPTYPAARFGEAQSVPPVVEASKPQALTTLEPGASGYAGVLLSAGDGSAANGRTETALTIPFDDGSVATVSLPAAGVHVDDSLSVTYWLTDRATALTY